MTIKHNIDKLITDINRNKSGRKLGIAEAFGVNVFNDAVMKKMLPKSTYAELKKVQAGETSLTLEVANVVANAMKDWAIARGASHYTHWFQPLTGKTAEKHDSFLSPQADGSAVAEFSGKQLIQGEPDASSFPSGGIRATFEARGYTAWDCTSPAFLKEDAAGDVTLCIPTAFCSYTGEALDKKTPLLRSMEAVSKQAVRVLHALGEKNVKRVTSTVGPEQEYFLIDKKFFDARIDLVSTGRTLFGAASPKGQELEDQYFGAIKDRISKFMKELDIELWKMGISSKTKHNEVAPAQYEMAPIFSTTNIAADHNQLVMETMQKVAIRNGLVCLLFEKPFAGVNGSGKHNNWSLATDTGLNLLEPGHTPHQNEIFLTFLAAVLTAVDTHADKLRAGAANPGNDLRLGANEAPPAIISVFLGSFLTQLMDNIVKGKATQAKGQQFLKIGVDSLPALPLDNTDRNRTSPFAFTGNKFEFRMVASSASIAGPNCVLNTIVAETLDNIANRLEKSKDVNKEVTALVKETWSKHHRVVFNGNNYSEEWLQEAAKRGLPNIRSSIEAYATMANKDAIRLFEKYKVLSKRELHSRFEVYVEQYVKHINIEARAALLMVKTQYLPAVIDYTGNLADVINQLKAAGADSTVQEKLLEDVSKLLVSAKAKLSALETNTQKASNISNVQKKAAAYRDTVFTAQVELRHDIDALEELLPNNLWPVPTYADMLFNF
ncbi:MAG: glutamine synthetase III [Elusimicrobia bacterium]|nr:glutamine synthetase III [Elusimicrobiota bacterium]MBI4217577.1 glutamine synthetase III [Elusimicrobiota bacterium]